MQFIRKLILFLAIINSCITIYAQKLFYCSNSTGTFQVYSKDLSNNNIDTITSYSNFNYWWVEASPDGTELLLMRSPLGSDIETMFDYDSCQMLKSKINGKNQKIILDYQANGWNAFGNPHWHPTEDRIVFLAQPTNEFYIFTMDTNGNNIVKLTNQFSIDPNWSRSGDKIVFIGVNPNPTPPQASFDDFEVFTADYNITYNSISNIQQLTNDTRRDHDPCYSPNDDRIAFSSAKNINLSVANITVIDTIGNNRTDLVSDNTTNGGPINWGENNKIYYHNVNFKTPPFTPFTAKAFDVDNNINTDLFPSISEDYISLYYFNNQSTIVINDLDEANTRISIYPNSSAKKIYFKCSDNAKNKVLIFNILGSKVEEFDFTNNYELDISSYSKGQYFYRVYGKEYNNSGILIKIE